MVSMAGGSGTVTAMGTSAASMRSSAKSPCPGPTSTTRYSAGSARSAASQRALRPARSVSAGCHGVVRGGKEPEPRNAGGHERAPQRRGAAVAHVGLDARRAQAEVRVQVGAARVGVDEDDRLAELGEVDGEVDGDEALAHAAAAGAHRDEATRASLVTLAGVRAAARGRGLVRRATG